MIIHEQARADDGSEAIALARNVGLYGVRSAPFERQDRSNAPAKSGAASRINHDDGSAAIALARSVGITGVRPASSS